MTEDGGQKTEDGRQKAVPKVLEGMLCRMPYGKYRRQEIERNKKWRMS